MKLKKKRLNKKHLWQILQKIKKPVILPWLCIETSNLQEVKNFSLYFLSNVKISIWTLLFYKKNIREKVNFFKISKGRYFLPAGRTDIIFGLREKENFFEISKDGYFLLVGHTDIIVGLFWDI